MGKKLFQKLLPVLVAGGALTLPPKEQLPAPFLYPRVLCEGIGRVLRCGSVGAFILFDYKYNLAGVLDQAAWDIVHQRSAEALVELAMLNGGLYVKAGQGFSHMNHLLPRQYCRTMKRLEDAVMTRPTSEVRAVIEADFGKPVEELFDEFSEEPIAAASLAQVHTAKIKGTQEEVAIKVQYIDIAHRFSGDVACISLCSKVCGLLFPGYDFGTILDRTRHTVENELRFIDEGENSDACAVHLKPRMGERVVTPRVFWDQTTDRVLVTELIKGCKVSDVKSIRAMGFKPRDVAEAYCATFAMQLFDTGLLHCDPHGGNCFVRPCPSNPKQPQLVLLDHGLYTQLSANIRQSLAEIWTSMARRDDAALKSACEKIGVHSPMLFASMLLQHPYQSFTLFKTQASAQDVAIMRHGSNSVMPKITAILETLPFEMGLALRNMNIVRAVNKDLGTPVSRSAIMLRESIKHSHKNNFWDRTSCLVRLWYDENMTAAVMAFGRWRHPELFEEMDEMLGMG